MAGGACNCGAVAFEIRDKLSQIFMCHCSICRRFSGSTGIAVVIVDNAGFSWLRGTDQIASWRKPDADWQSWFCRTCGSALPGPNDDTRMFVPAGLITDGADHLKVGHHIWVDSRAGWDEIGDQGRQHEEAFSG